MKKKLKNPNSSLSKGKNSNSLGGSKGRIVAPSATAGKNSTAGEFFPAVAEGTAKRSRSLSNGALLVEDHMEKPSPNLNAPNKNSETSTVEEKVEGGGEQKSGFKGGNSVPRTFLIFRRIEKIQLSQNALQRV